MRWGIYGWVLSVRQICQFSEEAQGFLGFLRVHFVQCETGMHDHVISHLGFGK